jgi:syntaxin-binding protein 5
MITKVRTEFLITVAGLLAVSYHDGSLFIIDLRGPRVILREFRSQPRNRHSFLKHSDDQGDFVMSLMWSVFKLASGKFSML